MKNIEINSSKKEVQRILGKPYSKKAYYNKDFFVYYLHQDLIDLIFTGNKFPFIGFYPIVRTGTEYWMIFDNDRLVSFGDAKNYGNSIPRALNDRGITIESSK